MNILGDNVGHRIIDAGCKSQGDCVDISAGRYAIWLVDGQATWQKGNSRKVEPINASDTLYELTGPGILQFLERSHYVRLEAGDALGFGPRASLYHMLMETRNRGIGEALAAGLSLHARQIWVDIGTGTGAMVQAIQERGAELGPLWIFGVDQAMNMIDEAWLYPQDRIPAWFVVRDVSAMPWPNGMVDGITALLLLHLVEDIDALLARLYGALKPGGTFAYAVSSDQNPFVRMVMRQLAGPGDFFKRGQRQVRESVLRAGFDVLRSDVYQDEIVLANPEAMRNLIGSIGAAASRGLRNDIAPPSTIVREFDLVWAQKPAAAPRMG